MNIKVDFNLPIACFNRLLELFRDVLPETAHVPKDFYQTKQLVKGLGLSYEKIDACPNNCIIYYKDNKHREKCPVCEQSRYKVAKRNNQLTNTNIPRKVLRYFPITPRLQRLYMSSKTAEHMTWHSSKHREEGVMSHPSDGEAWRHFDMTHPQFSTEERNVRLCLAADGFNPFGHMLHPYSCWPVMVAPYNLPSGIYMTTPYIFLSLVIPGPRSPGQKIDVFLQPLIDELNQLWEYGVNTYDAFKKENFILKAALMWTINDFPAYGMLSGWSTHGVLSCPVCMSQSKAFFLKNGGKTSFFDCHRRLLPTNHSFRKNKKDFRKGVAERSEIEIGRTGEDIWNEVQNYPFIEDKESQIAGFGKTHNWTKCSIFWTLPYWRTVLLRHNLDVMHIEKNVFDNIFNTVMDSKTKSKDNVKARLDIAEYCD